MPKRWTQKGFVLISDAEGVTDLHEEEQTQQILHHGFFTTHWEAKAEEAETLKFPEHLRHNLRILPAAVIFDDGLDLPKY